MHPEAKIALNYSNPFELLVAVILSAQCTDVRVNMVTPKLFAKYKSVEEFAAARPQELEKLIYSTGFYKNKAKSIKGAAATILKEFNGKMPDTMDALLKLPGVARKTANVVLNNAFGKSEGIVVDTHVIRISGKLGLVPQELVEKKNAVKIEQELMKIVPKKEWGKFSHLIIFHGRKICIARRPKCAECNLRKICPSSEA